MVSISPGDAGYDVGNLAQVLLETHGRTSLLPELSGQLHFRFFQDIFRLQGTWRGVSACLEGFWLVLKMGFFEAGASLFFGPQQGHAAGVLVLQVLGGGGRT